MLGAKKRGQRRARRTQASASCNPVRVSSVSVPTEWPHEALEMKCPAEVYQPSPRVYQGLPDIGYPLHDKTIVVTHCGRICLGKKNTFSQVFAGQAEGIKDVHDDIWLVCFMDYDLGYIDLETRVLEPLENPLGPRVLPM